MDLAAFAVLERLNAKIDVWIDEEVTYQDPRISGAFTLSPDAAEEIDKCFRSATCSNPPSFEHAWSRCLNYFSSNRPQSPDDMPITLADGVHLATADEITRCWSVLLWAKLLRLRIQQHRTDCYLSRLDEVTAFLETNLPRPDFDGDAPQEVQVQKTKLMVFYLLELCADADGLEQVSFAERARRLLGSRLADDPSFSNYYELLITYNMGLAYFHRSRYRLAAIEFSKIIREVETRYHRRDPGDAEAADYYDERLGDQLVFWPAVCRRADVQLKLQLAYHALRTLPQQFLAGESCTAETGPFSNRYLSNEPPSERRRQWMKLIEAEAYWQMNRLDLSSHCFVSLGANLFGPQYLRTSDRSTWTIPANWSHSVNRLIRTRCLGLVISDLIGYLEFTRLALQFPTELSGEEYSQRVAAWSQDNSLIMHQLYTAFSEYYFESAVRNQLDLAGYYEQFAAYLALLGDIVATLDKAIRSFKTIRQAPVTGLETAILRVGDMARQLHDKRLSQLIASSKVEASHRETRAFCVRCLESEPHWKHIRHKQDPVKTKLLVFYKKVRLAKTWAALAPTAHAALRESERRFITAIRPVHDANLRIGELDLCYQLADASDGSVANCKSCLGVEPGQRFLAGPDFRKAFGGLLSCAGEPRKHAQDMMSSTDYEWLITHYDEHFLRHLKSPSIHKPASEALHFMGLQRWNSASPAQGRSLGGGYFIYHTNADGKIDLGIAVDPGFDFVRNLFRTGFSLDDIDLVVITHAHVDHCRDFESIVVLLTELEKRHGTKKRVHAVFTLGVYKRLAYLLEDVTLRNYIEPYIIDIEREIETDYFEHLPNSRTSFRFVPSGIDGPSSMRYLAQMPRDGAATPLPAQSGFPRVEVLPTRAYHNDHSGYSDSFGFRIGIEMFDGTTITVGYTGDTRWVDPKWERQTDPKPQSDIARQYDDCEAVIVHLGSLIETGKYFIDYRPDGGASRDCEQLVKGKNHPYLPGALRLLSSLAGLSGGGRRPLVLLSEFGEELRGGIRLDLCDRLRRFYGTQLDFLPVDIGLDVLLWKAEHNKGGNDPQNAPRVRCTQCDDFVPLKKVEFERYGEDEGLYCVCSTCRRAVPADVLQHRMHLLYEVGSELRTAP